MPSNQDEITLKLTRSEIEAIIEWGGVVDYEFQLTEEDEKIMTKLRESLE
jgi:hypothetical protein